MNAFVTSSSNNFFNSIASNDINALLKIQQEELRFDFSQ